MKRCLADLVIVCLTALTRQAAAGLHNSTMGLFYELERKYNNLYLHSYSDSREMFLEPILLILIFVVFHRLERNGLPSEDTHN